ncbi:MAG: hypothetical protein QM496_17505 [Verrucomicrobiota bacterium]
MWKGLLIVSALILAGAAYLGFENKKSFETLHVEREKKQVEVEGLKDDLEVATIDLKKEVDITDKLVQETEGLNTKLTVAKSKESDYKGQIAALTSQVKAAETMLKKGQDFMREVPDIEARKVQMAELQNEIQEEESATQNVQLQIAEVNTRREKLQAAADELQALTNDQAAGRIRGVFKSTVRKAFNNWGFVIVGAGNEQGVVNRAQLDVTRRGQSICKLLVTTVEPGECVAEIIPGSMSPGQAIQPGDDVTKTNLPASKPLPASGAAPAAGSVPTPALPESAPGGMQLPPAGELMPDAPAAPAAGGMPAGADVDPFAPAAPGAPATPAPAKPDVDSDPFK